MVARIFYFLWMIIAAGLFYMSYQIPTFNFGVTGPETFPRWVVVALFILSTILFVRSLLKPENYDHNLIPNRRQEVMLAGFISYVILIELIGFYVVTGVYIIATILLLSKEKNWREVGKAAAIAVFTVLIIYLVFTHELKVFFPASVLP